MPGLYSITARTTLELIDAAKYNADHQNHIDNQTPSMTDDYSVDVSQMQTATDPGELGTESLPTSLAGEIERLRFMLKEAIGGAQWYTSPPTSLSSVGTSITSLTASVAAVTATHTSDINTLNATIATLVVAAGKAGGQTIKGGTAAGENLTLNSTNHATKGKILLGAASAFDEVNTRLGIGTASPTGALDVVAGAKNLRFITVTLADDATVALETLIQSHGILIVMTPESTGKGGIFYISGGNNTATVPVNFGNAVVTDTDGKICVLADGDGTYTLKNRLGSSFEFALLYLGV